MVLQVELAHLAEEAKRHHVKPLAYLSKVGNRCTVTVGDPNGRFVIQADTPMDEDQVRASLTEQGMLIGHGRWVPDPLAGELQVRESLFVAAVAYKSAEEKPGLWIHAYRGEPTVGDVVKAFYHEMSEEAGLTAVPLETFLAATEPHVLVLNPEQLEAFANQDLCQ